MKIARWVHRSDQDMVELLKVFLRNNSSDGFSTPRLFTLTLLSGSITIWLRAEKQSHNGSKRRKRPRLTFWKTETHRLQQYSLTSTVAYEEYAVIFARRIYRICIVSTDKNCLAWRAALNVRLCVRSSLPQFLLIATDSNARTALLSNSTKQNPWTFPIPACD